VVKPAAITNPKSPYASLNNYVKPCCPIQGKKKHIFGHTSVYNYCNIVFIELYSYYDFCPINSLLIVNKAEL